MKFITSVLCFGFLLIGHFFVQAQTPTPPTGKKWTVVRELTDEFNGASLDKEKWDDYHPHWVGRPPSKFLKGNAFVEGGFLKLRSTMKKHPSTVKDEFKDVWVNSAACLSKEKSAEPGYYYEARIKASSLSMTSSFWFRVGVFSEIDIIEHVGNPSVEKRQDDLPYEFGTNTHYYGPEKGPKPKGTKWRMPTRGRDEFHVYGMWWKSPKELIFYHNGKEINRLKPSIPLTENLKMVFDTEVFPFATAGVANIGLPLPKNLKDNTKNTMLVDWVRTYKLVKGKKVKEAKVGASEENLIIKDGVYKIESTNTKQYLLSNKEENYVAIMADSEVLKDQQWNIKHVGNGEYTIQNNANQRYLQVKDIKCNRGTEACSANYTGDGIQKWKIVKNKRSYVLISSGCSELALDRRNGVVDAKVQLSASNARNPNQDWKFVEVE